MRLDELLQFLAEERGLDLRRYKTATIERRTRKRIAELSLNGYEQYFEHVRANPAETNQLLDTVLINVTEFFRDPDAWELVAKEILPHLLRPLRPGDSFRAWVAGCSSGEEVYSLAILIAEFFGPRLPEFEIKIYATDADASALSVARRAEYTPERLRRVRPEWRHKYFSTGSVPRLNREIRRMVIFGRSDLARDAPISHVQMIVCRNVLIYFDSIAQAHILKRLHYALDPGGILFLGKSESKLSNSALFEPVDSRWRIFRKNHSHEGKNALNSLSLRPGGNGVMNNDSSSREHDLSRVNLYYHALLEVLEPGVFSLDAQDILITENKSALALWGLSGSKLAGEHIAKSALSRRCPELIQKVEESHRGGEPVKFECTMKTDGEARALAVTIRAVTAEDGHRVGSLIYAEDVSHRMKLQSGIEQLEATGEKLQSANEELETTNEELQSTNEELETTNEELQSTNEELETTNEELQSTNEELETTNEELQSLNEELENMNEELEFRSRELNALNSRYAETLERMPWAVTVLDSEGRVQFWNSAAEELFDMQAGSVVGLDLAQLPIEPSLRQALVQRRTAATESNTATHLRNQRLKWKHSNLIFDIHLTPLARDGGKPSLLLMFAPQQSGTTSKHSDVGNSRGENLAGAERSKQSRSKKSSKKAVSPKHSKRKK